MATPAPKPITPASTANIPLSMASVSIGYRPEHNLPLKIAAISRTGFRGLELGMPDLLAFAGEHLRKKVNPADYKDLAAAARVVKAMCDAKKLEVMLLQPFANYEGWREGSPERRDALARLDGWIEVMRAVGCKTLQVGSTDTPKEHASWDGGRDAIVADLRLLADKLAAHDLRVAYENWCWSTHAPDWRHVWDIVRAVDRPNIGLCLDTFQSAGGEWADPTTASGLLAGKTQPEADAAFQASMRELAVTVPASKIYLLQISDAYKMDPPLDDAPDADGMRPRAQWSKSRRPPPYQGYLPTLEVSKGVLGTGFRGWFSVEVFDAGADGQGREYDVEEFARVCAASTRRLIADSAETKAKAAKPAKAAAS